MIHHGDCLDVMAAMEPESVDAIVTDPPYGLEFMGKEWDKLGANIPEWVRTRLAGKDGGGPKGKALHGKGNYLMEPDQIPATYIPTLTNLQQIWHHGWAEAAYCVAKPSAYLLAFGGTRTVHRMTVALEDAGWIIRDMLVWGYASGFPKSKASLKPAWEPIVMARKPGPLRELAIDACRIGTDGGHEGAGPGPSLGILGDGLNGTRAEPVPGLGRWPANVILTDPIFDGGIDGVVGGGVATTGGNINGRPVTGYGSEIADERWFDGYGDTGTYSRFFLVPKAARSDREPVLGGLPERELRTMGDGIGEYTRHAPGAIQRQNVHPTVKPVDLMRHLVRLVTPTGGTVLDPFLGSGTTGIAAEMEGFEWIGIEREAEYVAIAEARLNGTQRGLAL